MIITAGSSEVGHILDALGLKGKHVTNLKMEISTGRPMMITVDMKVDSDSIDTEKLTKVFRLCRLEEVSLDYEI